MSLQQQVNAWANLTNDGYNSSAVRQLASMSTFGGEKVDAGLIASCIQLGTGNCQNGERRAMLGLFRHQRHDDLRDGQERAVTGRPEMSGGSSSLRADRARRLPNLHWGRLEPAHA